MPGDDRDPLLTVEAEDVPALVRKFGMDPKAHWSPLLSALAAVLEEHFRRTRLSSDPRGDSEAVISVIAESLGGVNVYLPRGDTLRRALRNARIAAEFSGNNIEELAQRYRLTARYIRVILESAGIERKNR